MILTDFPTEELKKVVNSHFWWHSIDLGTMITPGRKPLKVMHAEYDAVFGSIDLTGKSVLDVGAWNGGFSVEAARRGAGRVMGLDHATWNHAELKGRETFNLVSKITGLNLEACDYDLDTPAISMGFLPKFDVVLFLGVFYHLRDPLAATREVAKLAREALIVETHIEFLSDPRPAMILYPGGELNDDHSNWWGPNTACIVELLRMSGFKDIKVCAGSDAKRQIFHASR
jgi:tRNA (mo5U34)-methyltransferase